MYLLLRRNLFPLLAFSVLVSFSSCDKKGGCTDTTAENFDPSAEVEDGSCISQREKFIGAYTCNLLCLQPPNGVYESEIKPANDNLNDILITNLGGRVNNPTRATINRNTLTIQTQDPDGIGLYISGSGNIVGNTITISFQTGYAGESNSCEYEMIR